MESFTIKKANKPKVVADKATNKVNLISRNITLESQESKKEYDVVLSGKDALLPLKQGQVVKADLRFEYSCCNGIDHYLYYVLSFIPLEDNISIEYEEDYMVHLV